MSDVAPQNVECPAPELDGQAEQQDDDKQGVEPKAAPPQLGPAPQIDLSLSMDSILSAGAKEHYGRPEKLVKLSEENEKLDEKLKELQERLAAAEKRSQELEAKRRSQYPN